LAAAAAKGQSPAAMTGSLGSTVSRDFFDRRPFKLGGKIEKVTVE
jgi:hypothetical protein